MDERLVTQAAGAWAALERLQGDALALLDTGQSIPDDLTARLADAEQKHESAQRALDRHLSDG